jgi:type I restriction enzyme S subunit
MTDLPAGWTGTTLKAICSKIVDGSHNPPKAVAAGKPMLSARNIRGRAIYLDEFRFISDDDFEQEHARTQIQAGDVLLTIVGAIGRTAVVPSGAPAFALQRSVAVLRPVAIKSRALAYALEAPEVQKYMADNARGTAQKGIYLGTLATIEIKLPPAAEQQRIGDKLDFVLASVDACHDRLARIAPLLKRFRQSVLASATSGRLTEDWRRGKEFRTTRERFSDLVTESLVLLCHKRSFALALPQQGHCPRRAISR